MAAPSPAPFNMPGYSWDGHRFFKTIPGLPSSSVFRPVNPVIPSAPPAQSKPESASRQRKRLKRQQEKGKQKQVDQPSVHGLRSLEEGHRSEGMRNRQHHDLEAIHMSRMRLERTLYPDCLPMDESIVKVCFDEDDPDVVRVGGSNGSIATGSLSPSRSSPSALAWYPNDEHGWRTSWILPNRVTSLSSVGPRVLATCLGLPAQAIISTTSSTISLASVTLSPRKTSLWTSALSSNGHVALGGDRKVLLSRDVSNSKMEGIVTGGKNGDGAVFALEFGGGVRGEETIVAGMRNGRVKVFDERCGRGGDEEKGDRAQIEFSIPSSVTHVRRLGRGDGLLVAGMDGTLKTFDLRFPSSIKPIVIMRGHVNSFTRDVGLDVWREDFVAAAGQDGRIRLWSLRTGGNPLSTPTTSPFSKTYEEPIKALTFCAGHGRKGRGWGGLPELWVGDGPGLECYGLQ